VLVVGGGPAGTAAAIAAARIGAGVLLVERYNHLG
jgi:flavin-dependent dehydrogenase